MMANCLKFSPGAHSLPSASLSDCRLQEDLLFLQTLSTLRSGIEQPGSGLHRASGHQQRSWLLLHMPTSVLGPVPSSGGS